MSATPFAIVPPTIDHLSRAYYELAEIGACSVGLKKKWPYHPSDRQELFALAADLSRWDPRLLEVLVQFALDHWIDLIPQKLREKMKGMQTPQTIGVIASFVKVAAPMDSERNFFWEYVAKGLIPVKPQFYFLGLHHPGGTLAQRSAKESLIQFKEWGFLGRERVLGVGTWDQGARLNILRRQFLNKKQLLVSEYLDELDQTLSRQQAILDLKLLGAKPSAKGRSSYWVFHSVPQ